MTTEFVRVRDRGTGHEYTVSAALADNDAYERLDIVAVDPNGNPFPPVYAPEPEAPAEVEVVAEPKPGPKPTTAKPATNQEK